MNNNVTVLRGDMPSHHSRAMRIARDGTFEETPKEVADVDRVIRLMQNGWSIEAVSQEMKLEVGTIECMLLARIG